MLQSIFPPIFLNCTTADAEFYVQNISKLTRKEEVSKDTVFEHRIIFRSLILNCIIAYN